MSYLLRLFILSLGLSLTLSSHAWTLTVINHLSSNDPAMAAVIGENRDPGLYQNLPRGSLKGKKDFVGTKLTHGFATIVIQQLPRTRPANNLCSTAKITYKGPWRDGNEKAFIEVYDHSAVLYPAPPTGTTIRPSSHVIHYSPVKCWSIHSGGRPA